MIWHLSLRGGAYDRYEGEVVIEKPSAAVVAWCGKDGCSLTDHLFSENIDEGSAATYCLAAVDEDAGRAAYEVFEVDGLPLVDDGLTAEHPNCRGAVQSFTSDGGAVHGALSDTEGVQQSAAPVRPAQGDRAQDSGSNGGLCERSSPPAGGPQAKAGVAPASSPGLRLRPHRFSGPSCEGPRT